LILYIGVRRPDLIRPVTLAKVTWGQKFRALAKIWPVLVVAIFIFGGIFGGIFDPTEAGAVGTLTILVLLMCRKQTRRWKLLWPAIAKTGSTSAMIFLILGGAAAFSQFLVMTGVPRRLGEAITGLDMPMLGLLGLIIVFYLVMGCFLDSISMLSITIPIFNPIIKSLGIDPIWYAMVVILTIEIGMLTPPVGLNVYAAKAVAEPDVSLEDVFWGILPFFFASFLGLGIILAFPGLTTILPSLMFGD
jgi:tripartite ATP-independent transporter DctM subunit